VSILQDSKQLTPKKGTKRPPPVVPATKIRIAKAAVVPPCVKSLVWFQCAAPGLRFLQSRVRTHMAYKWLTVSPKFCHWSRLQSGCSTDHAKSAVYPTGWSWDMPFHTQKVLWHSSMSLSRKSLTSVRWGSNGKKIDCMAGMNSGEPER
jgi:hypothetical protein